MRKKHALLTTTPSDSHVWNLNYMHLYLEEQGYQVTNLGGCAPFALVEREARRGAYDLVVVTTVNGHGYLDGLDLAWRLAELPERRSVKLVIGGKLGLDLDDEPRHARSLLSAGYDGVFHGASAIADFRAFLDRLDERTAPPEAELAWPHVPLQAERAPGLASS